MAWMAVYGPRPVDCWQCSCGDVLLDGELAGDHLTEHSLWAIPTNIGLMPHWVELAA